MPDDPATDWKPRTVCVHGGYRASPESKAVVPPVVRSSTFLMDDEAYAARAAGRGGEVVTYTREANPSQRVVEERVAALDGAEAALVFSSGMAALHAVSQTFLEPGDHLLVSHTLYGGSVALVDELMPRLGIDVTRADFRDAAAVRAQLRERTRLLFCEGVSNPDLSLADLPGVAEVARAAGARLLVDATFTSPVGQRPIEHGAHVVVHSATKYLGGHSDLVAGVACGTAEDMARVQRWRTRIGGCLDPGAAYLLDRGLRTLVLRYRAQSAGAGELARWLERQPAVERVLYPGLESHPQHARAARLLDEPGGMLAFVHRGGDAGALAFARRLRLILEAPSLGGVETLLSLPAKMSHVHMSPDERRAAGIPPGLVRLTVGIEDPSDLIADLEQALAPDAASVPDTRTPNPQPS